MLEKLKCKYKVQMMTFGWPYHICIKCLAILLSLKSSVYIPSSLCWLQVIKLQNWYYFIYFVCSYYVSSFYHNKNLEIIIFSHLERKKFHLGYASWGDFLVMLWTWGIYLWPPHWIDFFFWLNFLVLLLYFLEFYYLLIYFTSTCLEL